MPRSRWHSWGVVNSRARRQLVTYRSDRPTANGRAPALGGVCLLREGEMVSVTQG